MPADDQAPPSRAEARAFSKYWYSLPHPSLPDEFVETDRRKARIDFSAGFSAGLAHQKNQHAEFDSLAYQLADDLDKAMDYQCHYEERLKELDR